MKGKEINPLSAIRFKECRAKANITQEQLSELSEYSIQQISYIENGKRALSAEAAKIFGKIFHVDAAYLLCETPYKTTDTVQTEEKTLKNDLNSLFYKLLFLLGERIVDVAPDGEAIMSNKDFDESAYIVIETLFPEMRYYRLTLKEFNAIKRDIFEYIQFKFRNSGHYYEPENLDSLHLDTISKNISQLANEDVLLGDGSPEKIIETALKEEAEKTIKTLKESLNK